MRSINGFWNKAACWIIGGGYDVAGGRFPEVVRIETTNACNAQCIICPHKDMDRSTGQMDDTRFHGIVDECSSYGCKEIHLHNFGEPLLDKHLEEKVRFAKEKGIPKVKIFSNGSLLNENRARGLVEAGLDEIKLSIDGATKEEFERIRFPLKFDEVIGNIRRLVEIRDEMGSRLKVSVACCSTSDKEGTMQSLEKVVDRFSFGKIHNWTINGLYGEEGKIRKPCYRVWQTFTVLVNCDVALCCLDYDGKHVLGQIDDKTGIHEIWNSEEYRRIRAFHRQARQGELSLCSNCSKSFFFLTRPIADEPAKIRRQKAA